jgi:hypothetical protein
MCDAIFAPTAWVSEPTIKNSKDIKDTENTEAIEKENDNENEEFDSDTDADSDKSDTELSIQPEQNMIIIVEPPPTKKQKIDIQHDKKEVEIHTTSDNITTDIINTTTTTVDNNNKTNEVIVNQRNCSRISAVASQITEGSVQQSGNQAFGKQRDSAKRKRITFEDIKEIAKNGKTTSIDHVDKPTHDISLQTVAQWTCQAAGICLGAAAISMEYLL